MGDLGKCVHAHCHYRAKVVELGEPLCFVHADVGRRERWRIRFARYEAHIKAEEERRAREAQIIAAYPSLVESLKLAKQRLETRMVSGCLDQISGAVPRT